MRKRRRGKKERGRGRIEGDKEVWWKKTLDNRERRDKTDTKSNAEIKKERKRK